MKEALTGNTGFEDVGGIESYGIQSLPKERAKTEKGKKGMVEDRVLQRPRRNQAQEASQQWQCRLNG